MITRALGRRLAACVLGLLVVAAVIVASSSATIGRGERRAVEPRLSEGQILRLAIAAAASAGDPQPTLIQHAEGTREKANLIDSGSGVPGTRWSYLIAERGHFVFKDVSIAPGASSPTGTVLTLIVDAATRQITDSGLSNRYPPLSKLGVVETDLSRAPAVTEASCVGLTRAQQVAAAKLIVIGTMLPGLSQRIQNRRVLLSPARLRVIRYLKGSGRRTVAVQTGVSAGNGGTSIQEDGILPSAGQRWEILSSSPAMPLQSSICLGSRRLSKSRSRSASRLVPVVVRLDLDRAYARLHRAGLRVSFPRSFSEGSFACVPTVAHEHPDAPSRVAAGATISLTAQPPRCGVGSPAVPNGRLPSVQVPEFTGRLLSAAASWAEKHGLYWQANSLPPLVNADAARLLENYRVIDQTPPAGSRLSLGLERGGGNHGSFQPTPLILQTKFHTPIGRRLPDGWLGRRPAAE